jgi:predicted Zn-dependent protease
MTPTEVSLHRPALLQQAQMALQSGANPALDQAAQALQGWVAQQPADALAWQGLAGVYAAQGQGLRALRAQAEERVAYLDYAGALDRLKAAQDFMGASAAKNSSASHIDASIIDTRRRQIEALLKQLALER